MTAKKEPKPTRIDRRIERMKARLAGANTAEDKLAVAYDWVRASAAQASRRSDLPNGNGWTGTATFGPYRSDVEDRLRRWAEQGVKLACELDRLGDRPSATEARQDDAEDDDRKYALWLVS